MSFKKIFIKISKYDYMKSIHWISICVSNISKKKKKLGILHQVSVTIYLSKYQGSITKSSIPLSPKASKILYRWMWSLISKRIKNHSLVFVITHEIFISKTCSWMHTQTILLTHFLDCFFLQIKQLKFLSLT